MASPETQQLDSIISSRRALLATGGAALAALALPTIARAASTVSTYTDTDILNFALNLEYLEANFYYLAAFGTNISTTNSLYPTGAMVQSITGTGTQGTVIVKRHPQGSRSPALTSPPMQSRSRSKKASTLPSCAPHSELRPWPSPRST